MKGSKIGLAIAAVALLTIGSSGAALAFHSGGVAECGGCHAMHAPKTGGSNLLLGSDQSSTCLICHNSADTAPTGYHVSTDASKLSPGVAPVEMTPGGDFAWLKKSYTFAVRGTPTSEAGDTHGHNIIAADFGYGADGTNVQAPGGTFTSANLACNSCHDPHGKYRRDASGAIKPTGLPIANSGSYQNSVDPVDGKTAVGAYRLLAGAGYSKGGATFPGNPAAVVPSTYNRSEATTQTRAAYGISTGSGHAKWGDWCGTCHGNMHSTSGGHYVHPTDQTLGSTITSNYNAYVKSGDMTGSATSSFLSLIPFIKASTTSYADLKLLAQNNDTKLDGPTSTDEVSCLSCHRAHASGFPEMLRWAPENEFITATDASGIAIWAGTENDGGEGKLSRGRSIAETQASYYGRAATKFAANQRSLCNKCHAKD